MSQRIFWLSSWLLLAGCASTGVINTDKDTFMVSKQSAAGIFGTPGGVTADVYAEANAYCRQQGRVVETVNLDSKEAKPFVRTGSATLYFKCAPQTMN